LGFAQKRGELCGKGFRSHFFWEKVLEELWTLATHDKSEGYLGRHLTEFSKIGKREKRLCGGEEGFEKYGVRSAGEESKQSGNWYEWTVAALQGIR